MNAREIVNALDLSRGDKVVITFKNKAFVTNIDPATGMPSETMANIPVIFSKATDELLVVDQDIGGQTLRRAFNVTDVYVGILIENPLVQD